MAEDIDASHTAGNAATATPSMETATMADIDLSIDAPALPDVPAADGRGDDISIDDIVARIRAAHAQGMAIEDINNRLEVLLTDTATGKPSLRSSPTSAAVPFPLPEPNPAIKEITSEQRGTLSPGSQVWQSPATRSKPPQPHETPRKSAIAGTDSSVWVTEVGHNDHRDAVVTTENCAENSRPQRVTTVGHKRSNRGLYRRGSIYQFRVRVPGDLRDVIGPSHVKRSLQTDSRSLAIRLSRKVASEVEAAFEEARRKKGLAHEGKLLAERPVPTAVAVAKLGGCEITVGKNAGPTLSEVYERYLQDPTKRRSDRTMLAHHTTRRVIEDVFGSERSLATITREDCRDLLETLRWLPVNVGKKFGAIPIRDAASLARADARIKTINATNLNAYMARFATMLNWAVAEEYIGRNPARGLQIAEPVHPQDRRKPFEPWQLRRIFTAPIYTGCRDDQQGYAATGDKVANGARYWVALIALWSGMRLNEVCQLDVADVRVIEGVHCFAVTATSLVGTRDKTLKTKSSERLVPVHPVLHGLGFIAFVEQKRKTGAIKIFDDIPVGARGFRSVAFSRWFSRFLVSANAASARTCFHSFRHGFRDAARNAQIDRDVALRLGGWITGGTHSETADDYGSGYRPQVLFKAISAIEYPELDLSRLMKHMSEACRR